MDTTFIPFSEALVDLNTINRKANSLESSLQVPARGNTDSPLSQGTEEGSGSFLDDSFVGASNLLRLGDTSPFPVEKIGKVGKVTDEVRNESRTTTTSDDISSGVCEELFDREVAPDQMKKLPFGLKLQVMGLKADALEAESRKKTYRCIAEAMRLIYEFQNSENVAPSEGGLSSEPTLGSPVAPTGSSIGQPQASPPTTSAGSSIGQPQASPPTTPAGSSVGQLQASPPTTSAGSSVGQPLASPPTQLVGSFFDGSVYDSYDSRSFLCTRGYGNISIVDDLKLRPHKEKDTWLSRNPVLKQEIPFYLCPGTSGYGNVAFDITVSHRYGVVTKRFTYGEFTASVDVTVAADKFLDTRVKALDRNAIKERFEAITHGRLKKTEFPFAGDLAEKHTLTVLLYIAKALSDVSKTKCWEERKIATLVELLFTGAARAAYDGLAGFICPVERFATLISKAANMDSKAYFSQEIQRISHEPHESLVTYLSRVQSAISLLTPNSRPLVLAQVLARVNPDWRQENPFVYQNACRSFSATDWDSFYHTALTSGFGHEVLPSKPSLKPGKFGNKDGGRDDKASNKGKAKKTCQYHKNSSSHSTEECKHLKKNPGGVNAALVSESPSKILVAETGKIVSGAYKCNNAHILVDTVSSMAFVGSKHVPKSMQEKLRMPLTIETMNGNIELVKGTMTTKLLVYIGEIPVFCDAVVVDQIPGGADALIPFHAIAEQVDSATFDKARDASRVFFRCGDTESSATFVTGVQNTPSVLADNPVLGCATVDSQDRLSVMSQHDFVQKAAQAISEFVQETDLADDIPAYTEGHMRTDCTHDPSYDLKGATVEQKVQVYRRKLLEAGGDPELVERFISNTLKHHERESSQGDVPAQADPKIKWSDCIKSGSGGFISKLRSFGQKGSQKLSAIDVRIKAYENSGALGPSRALQEVLAQKEDVVVLCFHPVLKDQSLGWEADNVRLTVNGKEVGENELLDKELMPQQLRREPAISTLVKATDDPNGEPRFFLEVDAKNGYMQGGSQTEEEARVYMHDVESGRVRALLRPIYGYPTSGTHFDNVVVQKLKPHNAEKGYVDDFNFGRHDVNVFLRDACDLLEDLFDNGFTLSMKKFFFRDHLNKFGVHVCEKGIQVNAETLRMLIDIQLPKTRKEFVSNAALLRYFAKFLPELDKQLKPISDYFHGKSPMPSDDVKLKDWEGVTNLLRRSVTLNHFDKTLDMIVGTDWSTGGRSAIVFQVSKDKTKVHVVAHFYRANSRKYERLMPAFLGELETITEASEHFGDMIAMLEAQLIFLSDHKPIIDASKDDFKRLLEDGTKRYPRLIYAAIDKLAALNAIYCSIAGVDNYPPDLKSRTGGEVTKRVLVPRNKMLYEPGGEILNFKDISGEAPTPLVVAATLAGQHQSKADRLRILRDMSVKAPSDPVGDILRSLSHKQDFDRGMLADALLPEEMDFLKQYLEDPSCISITQSGIKLGDLLYVPPEKRYDVIYKSHSLLTAGHFQTGITSNNTQLLTWPGKKKDIDAFVHLCPECDRENGKFEKGTVRPLPVGPPFETIIVDIKPVLGYNVFVIKESTFGHKGLYPLRNKDVSSWIAALDYWRGAFGPFSVLISDADSVVTSHAFKEYAELNGFQIRTSSPKHKSQGVVEIEMKFINAMLAKAGPDQADIERIVPKIAYALNARHTIQCGGMFFNTYGMIRGVVTPTIAERSTGVQPPVTDFYSWLIEAATIRSNGARFKLEAHKIPFFPEDLEPAPYPSTIPVGSLVWVDTKSVPNAEIGTTKTMPKATGPYLVVGWEESGVTARLQSVSDPSVYITRNIEFLRLVKALPEDVTAPDEFVVEDILGELRNTKGEPIKFLVKWKNFDLSHCSYVDIANFYHDALKEKWLSIPKDERKRRSEEAKKLLKSIGKSSIPAISKDPTVREGAVTRARSKKLDSKRQ